MAVPGQTDVGPDGMLRLDTAQPLPAVLDILIVGGGPCGTAAAFRAKELGLSALVIDMDDLMTRIREYPKGKPILPDYGGGDTMQFPDGGELVRSLQFAAIDKDDLCDQVRALYRTHNVPALLRVEMTSLEQERGDSELWRVIVWNRNTKSEQTFRARSVVLACGRGVPRKLEIPGPVDLLAFGLKDPALYVGAPACVIGGGTSAAEAVIAISNAKQTAGDPSAVYWSYRKAQMPSVSKALADVFFDAFVGNGNVRYLPTSDPIAVILEDNEPWLAVRTARVAAPDAPVHTTQLEFPARYAVACIGADIPEQLFNKIGIPLVTGGPRNRKRIVVTPGLETRLPNLFLVGDTLSNAYFETTDFDADPAGFDEIQRRGNIKAALRDGVAVAEVIKQKLSGSEVVRVDITFVVRPEPVATGPALSSCRFVMLLPSGVEADEYRVKAEGATTLGRQGADISFPRRCAAVRHPRGDRARRGQLRARRPRQHAGRIRAARSAGRRRAAHDHQGGKAVAGGRRSTGKPRHRALRRRRTTQGDLRAERGDDGDRPGIAGRDDCRRRHVAITPSPGTGGQGPSDLRQRSWQPERHLDQSPRAVPSCRRGSRADWPPGAPVR
jgi:thioredoxin reductase